MRSARIRRHVFVVVVALWLAAVPRLGFAEPPVFLGDVPVDFDVDTAVTVLDPDGQDIIDYPESGNDIEDLRFYYDRLNDILYVGINSYWVAGDWDGDGLSDSLGFGFNEFFAVAFDVDGDGCDDVVAGKQASDILLDSTTFQVSEVFQAAFPNLAHSFQGPPAGGPYVHTVPSSPVAGEPDLEFAIQRFSELPAIMPEIGAACRRYDASLVDEPGAFRVRARMGTIMDTNPPTDLVEGFVDGEPYSGELVCFDTDGDGWAVCGDFCVDDICGNDCDDTRDSVHPAHDEVCDGLDNDCDSETDEADAVDAVLWFLDEDQDGFGDEGQGGVAGCTAPGPNYVDVGGDCADGDPAVKPDAFEVCDGIDNDCDGLTDDDDDSLQATTWYLDGDEDGFGIDDSAIVRCEQPVDHVDMGGDCDDTDATLSPGEEELCDGIDNDCDGLTDDADPDVLPEPWYRDGDEDGYGNRTDVVFACVAPDGYVADNSDCDDTSASISPAAVESCDGIDNDCDGATDDADDSLVSPGWYRDQDGDNAGDEEHIEAGCEAPEGYVALGGDCDDDDEDIGPAEDERCDGVDNDCDGLTDEQGASDATAWYRDVDGDGFGDEKQSAQGCYAPAGYVGNADDCDDTDHGLNTQDDCCLDADGDGLCERSCLTDTPLSVDCSSQDPCLDYDHDGYGRGPGCAGLDCDDQNAYLNSEPCANIDTDGDGLFEDCLLLSDAPDPCPEPEDDCVDRDRDGYGIGPGCLGEDCDDSDVMTKGACGSGAGEYEGSGIAEGCSSAGDVPSTTGSLWIVLFAIAALLVWRRRAARPFVLSALVGVMLVGLFPQTVQAADGLAIQHFLIKPGDDRILSVEGSEVAPAWSPYGGVWFHVVDDPLRLELNVNGRKEERRLIRQQVIGQFAVGIGLFDYAELEAVLPVILSGNGDDAAFDEADGASMADMVLRVRGRFIERTERSLGFGLGMSVAATLPTGESSAAAGDGMANVQPKIIGTWGRGPLLLALNLGFNFRTDPSQFQNIELDHELTYGLGFRLRHQERKLSWGYGAELTGRTLLADPFADDAHANLELNAGAHVTVLNGLTIEGGLGGGIVQGYGAPDFRLFLGVQWAEPVGGDADRDGILDKSDACPFDAEDRDGFQDEDGCPEADNDNDGLLDPCDACPNEPEDRDGFEDEDGCPEADNDQDGILDDADSCPIDPEDRDGFEDEDGCPDPDNDRDGFLDKVDKCPDEPENVNGCDDEDGCPDDKSACIVIDQESKRIYLHQKIFFDFDKASIRPESYEILEELATALKAHPELAQIEVQGHTDNEGSHRYNKRLSQRRVDSVVRFLVRYGVARSRLRAKGYGETSPLEPNTTVAGRSRNRRVEFHILRWKD